MEKIDKQTYSNILESIKNLKQWSLMRVLMFVICLLNLSLVLGQIWFKWVTPTFFIEYALLVMLGYWIFLFKNAVPSYLKICSDFKNFKKCQKVEERQISEAFVCEEHLAYIKERESKGLFSSVQRHMVINTYHYNIDHLVHNVSDFSNPVTIFKLPKSNTIVGLQQNTISELTETELDILIKIHQGLADKKIARELKYTPSTVRSYNSRIFKKLGVKTRKEAVNKAVQIGLLE